MEIPSHLELLNGYILNWTVWIRKQENSSTIHYALYPHSSIDRLYQSCRNGSRGLLQMKQTVEKEKHALSDYLKDNREALKQIKNGNLLNVQETKYEYWNNIHEQKQKQKNEQNAGKAKYR